MAKELRAVIYGNEIRLTHGNFVQMLKGYPLRWPGVKDKAMLLKTAGYIPHFHRAELSDVKNNQGNNLLTIAILHYRDGMDEVIQALVAQGLMAEQAAIDYIEREKLEQVKALLTPNQVVAGQQAPAVTEQLQAIVLASVVNPQPLTQQDILRKKKVADLNLAIQQTEQELSEASITVEETILAIQSLNESIEKMQLELQLAITHLSEYREKKAELEQLQRRQAEILSKLKDLEKQQGGNTFQTSRVGIAVESLLTISSNNTPTTHDSQDNGQSGDELLAREANLQNNVTRLKGEIQSAEGERQQKISSLDKLKQDIAQKEVDVQRMKAERIEADQAIEESEYQEKLKQLEVAQSDLAGLRGRIQELEASTASLKSNLQAAPATLRPLTPMRALTFDDTTDVQSPASKRFRQSDEDDSYHFNSFHY